jgi:hypothetical protein
MLTCSAIRAVLYVLVCECEETGLWFGQLSHIRLQIMGAAIMIIMWDTVKSVNSELGRQETARSRRVTRGRRL